MNANTDPPEKGEAAKLTLNEDDDQELFDHLVAKAVKTIAWEAEQRKRHHELFQAVFAKKKTAKPK